MLPPRFVVSMSAAGVIVLIAGLASGQNYPNRPVRIVTAESGGGMDFASRLIAQELSLSLGQQVIVENRGGAGAAMAGETLAKAPPDGHTVLLYGSAIWLAPLLRDNVPWDAVKDFSPITLASSSPNVIVVHPSLPAKSVKDLIALAKARPGELNYASGGTGSSNHLAAELFKAMAGVNIVRIPYKGTAPALNDLVGGQVQVSFASAGSVAPFLAAGRLRALAVTSAEPSTLVPGLPTAAASGLPGYESASLAGIFAPAKTPAAIIHRLNQEIVRILNKADIKKKLFNAGVETVGSSPEELLIKVKAEIARLGKVIKEAGIRSE